MEALDELKYKANYASIFEWLQEVQEIALQNNRTEFATKVQAAKDMLEENWHLGMGNCNDVRRLQNIISEQGIKILENENLQNV